MITTSTSESLTEEVLVTCFTDSQQMSLLRDTRTVYTIALGKPSLYRVYSVGSAILFRSSSRVEICTVGSPFEHYTPRWKS